MFDSVFVTTEVSINKGQHDFVSQIIALWNFLLGKIPFLRISPKNLTFSSALEVFLEDKSHQNYELLDYGFDAITLRLDINPNSDLIFESLSDYLKLIEYAYRIAESNDRAIESTYFTYLISNPNHTLLKNTIVLIGFFSYGLILIYVVW